jgi:YidC/Oxa1 family membrane protein insertase
MSLKKYTIYLTLAFVAIFLGFFSLVKYMSHGTGFLGKTNLPTEKLNQDSASASTQVLPTQNATSPDNSQVLGVSDNLNTPKKLEGTPFESSGKQVLESAKRKFIFSNKGGCLKRAELLSYKKTVASPEPAQSFSNYLDCGLFGVKIGETDFRSVSSYLVSDNTNLRKILLKQGDITLTKEFLFSENNYTGKLKISIKNDSASPINSVLAIELGAHTERKGSGGILNTIPMELSGIVYENAEKVKRTHATFADNPAPESLLYEQQQPIAWAGSETSYFLNALIPVQKGFFNLNFKRTGFNVQPHQGSDVVQNVVESWLEQSVQVPALGTAEFEFDTYIGPKSKTELEQMTTQNAQVNLVPSIDYGMFRIVAWPVYSVLNLIFKYTNNWGLAIIFLTIVIKILFIPLMAKAFTAGKKMQEIQPELNAVKEKYKDDKQLQQKEIMSLMSQKGVNPMSGCLPILPQIPVFFGLNAVLTHTFELRQAPFLGWIVDLSSKDPFYISPAVMAVLMFVQQKLTPMPSMEPTQQKIMLWMPVIFAVFMLAYPSGLVLYIMTNTIMSVAQQQYMIKRYSPSTTTGKGL